MFELPDSSTFQGLVFPPWHGMRKKIPVLSLCKTGALVQLSILPALVLSLSPLLFLPLPFCHVFCTLPRLSKSVGITLLSYSATRHCQQLAILHPNEATILQGE